MTNPQELIQIPFEELGRIVYSTRENLRKELLIQDPTNGFNPNQLEKIIDNMLQLKCPVAFKFYTENKEEIYLLLNNQKK